MDYKSKNIKTVGKVTTPFYEPPARKTSAEIINEARLAIRESQMADSSFISTSIKPIQTKRPFTPKDKERILFGKDVKSKRPPSSFSLRYLQGEVDIPVTPPDTSAYIPNKVSTLNFPKKPSRQEEKGTDYESKDGKIFNIGLRELNVHKIKLPSLDSNRPLQKRKLTKGQFSLDNLPEENDGHFQLEARNAFSSPQENTNFEENTPTKLPARQKSLSECLLLGPQNLNRIFENKDIMQSSTTLFSKTEMCGNMKERTFDDVLEILNLERYKQDENITINLLNELYECMEKENMINVTIGSKTKVNILRCLYKYVDSQNEQLLLNIGRIILALKVTGNNLSGVCKLIFKVSKNDKNDNLFFQRNVLELFLDSLGRCSPLDDAEACVYAYGAVKFLTMNHKLLAKISELGILPLMVLHLKIVNSAKLEKTDLPQHTNHAVFQLMAALRNLVSEDLNYETFLSSGAVQELCHTMELFVSDSEIVGNISRILSTSSMNDSCCNTIAEYKNIFKTFIKLLEKYSGNEEIIVRLAFTLGNIVAKLDNCRVKYYEERNSINCLINLWKTYLERTLKHCSLKTENDNDDDVPTNSEDVMIKIIRIIANMVINPEIGKAINEKYGVQLIDEFLKVLISNPFKKNEELVLSILSTLNNLSYYYSSDLDQNIFNMKQVDILEGITEYVRSTNKECVVETTRIMGNLSRSKVTRNYIVESEIFNMLLRILLKDDCDQLRTTVGVFVNLMADNKSRQLFKTEGGISKLLQILNKLGQDDWPLSTLICQAIWNFCIDTPDLYDMFSDSELQELLSLLADYLDEERLFGVTETTNEQLFVSHEYTVWEEFANVATNLLEKIEYFLDALEISEKEEKTRDSSTNISFSAW